MLVWHTRLLAFLLLLGAILSVLIGIGISTAEDEFQILPIIVFTAWAAVLFTARNGILFRKPWGRTFGFVACSLLLIGFPIGTAVGIYGIVILRKAKRLFYADSSEDKVGQFDLRVTSVQTDGVPQSEWPFDVLLKRSTTELQVKTRTHDSVWDLGKSSWSVDQESGTITFTRPTGEKAIASVQIIGTYNPEESTWLWGWDHPSVLPPLQEHALKVREFGAKQQIDRLTTQKIKCTQDEAWELTALACSLAGAQGAYRGPAGPALVFVTFGELKMSKG